MTIATAALDKKAKDIAVMDLRGLSSLCEFQVICSGDSDRQVAAIAEHIESVCKTELNLKPSMAEGKSTANWILLDFHGVMVHIFIDDFRRYYAIESLWPEAKITPVTAATKA